MAALAVTIAGLALPHVLTIEFSFEENYNEGWNAYNAERLLHHEVIYDSNLWRVNNYPLVSFLVVGVLGKWLGNLLLAGRIVAVAAFTAIGILSATITRQLGGDRLEAAFAGLCALGFYLVIAPAWVAVDDPQALAEALMLGGLAAYLKARATSSTPTAAALLATTALFTKHNLFAIPLAITLDLACLSWRRLVSWLACCGLFAGLLFAVTELIAGGDFIGHLLQPRAFISYNVYYHLMKFVLSFKLPLLVIVWLSQRIMSAERFVIAMYGILSVGTGVVLSGVDGTSFNMLIDGAVFLAIAAGLTLRELRRQAARGPMTAVVAIVAAVALASPVLGRVSHALRDLLHPDRLLASAKQRDGEFMADVAYVRSRSGTAICESLLLCFEAGAPFTLDPFNSRQNILSGHLDQDDLLRHIAQKEFSVIQLRAEICDDTAAATCHILHYPRKFNRFTDEFLYAVDRYYRLERRSETGVYYSPR